MLLFWPKEVEVYIAIGYMVNYCLSFIATKWNNHVLHICINLLLLGLSSSRVVRSFLLCSASGPIWCESAWDSLDRASTF